MKSCMKSVWVSLKSKYLRLKTGVGMFGNRRQQTYPDDDLDLLGDEDIETFTGSHAGLAETGKYSPELKPGLV